jgi:DNA-binding NarL/FixJ family response regulator
MLRILTVDEHDVARDGLRVHLEAQPNWQVVAEATHGKEAVQKAIETNPDVVVAAYELPEVDGIDVVRQIRTNVPKAEVLIYTARGSDNLVDLLLQAGARGCVLKSEPMDRLVQGVREVAARKPYFAGTTQAEGLHKKGRNRTFLTAREISIVRLIAEGHTNKEAARMLGISLKTVETHRLNVMNKLELGSFAALVRYAVRNQLIEA